MKLITAEVLNSRLRYLFGNEIEYLNDLGRSLKDDALVVMLGVGPAIMALALLEEASAGVAFFGFDHNEQTILYAEQHIRAAELPQQITFVFSDTVDAADMIGDNSVDLLLVDADHTFSGVSRDIVAWWSKVKKDGLILFHDYIKLEADNGVMEAINKHKDEHWEETDKPGVSIVFRKV